MVITDPPAEITPGLWMLGTSEYPLYLVRDEEGCTVFEGGTGAMGPVLMRQLADLGVPAEAVRQVVVTHAHPDHVMAVPMFRRTFPQVAVLASEAAARTMQAEKAVGFFAKVDGALTGALLQAGSITEQDRPEPLDEPTIPVDRAVGEGDTIQAGTMVFHVLATPGHSECSLSFHAPDSGVLVISDATGYYLPEHEYWWPNYFTGYGDYLASIRRLAALNAKVLCLSHNAAIVGPEEVEAYFSGAIAATEEYHKRIVEQARAGRDAREIAEQLGSEVYEKTQLLPVDFFQKNAGLMVKQSLKQAGIGAA